MASIVVDSLAEQVAAALREEILSGQLKPGDHVNLEKTAARWNISMTPVRDAVRALEERGLLTIKPRVGVFVSELDVASFQELFEIRTALECQAVRSAIHRIPEKEIRNAIAKFKAAEEKVRTSGDVSLLVKYDELVHELITDHCPNRRLVDLMKDMKDLVRWVRRTVVQHLAHAYEAALSEHMQVLEALLKRDEKEAESTLRQHLQNSCRRTMESW